MPYIFPSGINTVSNSISSEMTYITKGKGFFRRLFCGLQEAESYFPAMGILFRGQEVFCQDNISHNIPIEKVTSISLQEVEYPCRQHRSKIINLIPKIGMC